MMVLAPSDRIFLRGSLHFLTKSACKRICKDRMKERTLLGPELVYYRSLSVEAQTLECLTDSMSSRCLDGFREERDVWTRLCRNWGLSCSGPWR